MDVPYVRWGTNRIRGTKSLPLSPPSVPLLTRRTSGGQRVIEEEVGTKYGNTGGSEPCLSRRVEFLERVLR